jgi:hypothetical protein
MDDVHMLAQSMEEDAAATCWSMEDATAECSPIKGYAAVAGQLQPTDPS